MISYDAICFNINVEIYTRWYGLMWKIILWDDVSPLGGERAWWRTPRPAPTGCRPRLIHQSRTAIWIQFYTFLIHALEWHHCALINFSLYNFLSRVTNNPLWAPTLQRASNVHLNWQNQKGKFQFITYTVPLSLFLPAQMSGFRWLRYSPPSRRRIRRSSPLELWWWNPCSRGGRSWHCTCQCSRGRRQKLIVG